MPIKRQCELLNIARSTAYYQPIGHSAEEIELPKFTLSTRSWGVDAFEANWLKKP
ncbi:integrase catalytic region domain protein [Vibrio cholerae HC-52A1]|nr:integrase catalytic region domain protein [Vibrio cholerae HC-02A1]EKG54505.1 integrase catalytic region domain protein [Vibrio cholerae HC-50A1]EKG59718.1 integrase catalytic region domain protein [Vibrio cholerae HC-52A1]EKG63086.1 integrase catalytic region domain protein [Vibrio cholerae HC-56A1]EKG65204.1 integrase catalytic region domain protein [Vibrio cholerae HC-55A1]EKG74258.1 integrase catalytic region domain protein [Vibrio cholerae HC-57A1]EKL16261.1 hypothetical protein VCHC6